MTTIANLPRETRERRQLGAPRMAFRQEEHPQANMIVPRPLPSMMNVVRSRVKDIFETHPIKIATAVALTCYAFSQKDRIMQKVRELPQMLQNFKNLSTAQRNDVITKTGSLVSGIVSLYLMRQQLILLAGGRIDLSSSDRDLSRKSKRGQLPPMTGRNEVIDKVFASLLCTDKPNVVLVGPPGVGKTAIAEGLAMRLAKTPKAQLPESLRNVKVIEIKTTEFQSGTAFAGSFEQKLELFLRDVENSPNLIIFIDEIHALMNIGSGSSNLTDILKPLLARGKCRIIGATTNIEYAALEKDGAFNRRFQRIDVYEPKGRELKAIVRASAQRYADKHVCKYTQEALQKAIDASEKLTGYYPDKALTLLDQAGAIINQQFPNDRDARIVKPNLIEHCARKNAGSSVKHMGLNGPLLSNTK